MYSGFEISSQVITIPTLSKLKMLRDLKQVLMHSPLSCLMKCPGASEFFTDGNLVAALSRRAWIQYSTPKHNCAFPWDEKAGQGKAEPTNQWLLQFCSLSPYPYYPAIWHKGIQEIWQSSALLWQSIKSIKINSLILMNFPWQISNIRKILRVALKENFSVQVFSRHQSHWQHSKIIRMICFPFHKSY